MLILALISLISLYGCYLWLVARKYAHLPAHLGSEFPIIGNLIYSLKNSFLSHDDIIARLQKLLPQGGGLCVMWIYFLPVVAISDPLIVDKLAEHPGFADKEPLVYENSSNLWKGVFAYANTDKKWKQRRKIINQSFKKNNMQNYHNTFVKMAKRMADKMEQEKRPFNIERYTIMAASDSIVETHFGSDLNMIDDNELYGLMHWGLGKLSTSLVNPVFGFFMNIALAVSNVANPIYKVLEITKKNILNKQQNETKEDGMNSYAEDILQQYQLIDGNSKEMKQELVEIILVGSHTVGVLVKTALIFLATLPEIQEKVWQEQKNIFGDSDRDPTLTDVKSMDYLERVVKEVIRFISGPSLIRRTKEEINIDGKIIPANTTVLISSRLMRMDEKFWKNPKKFDPDRYLENEPSNNYPISFFGYGIRNCPGVQYAYNEGKIMLSTVLRRFKVISDRRFEDIKMSAQLMMEITEGQNVSIIKRKI